MLQTYCHLTLNTKEPCGLASYGSGWRNDVINQCLEFGNTIVQAGQ